MDQHIDTAAALNDDDAPAPIAFSLEEEEPPAGIGFVFDTGVRLIEEQADSMDGLDKKAGPLWALIAAGMVWSASFISSSQQFEALVRLQTGGSILAAPAFIALFTLAELTLAAAFLSALIALFPQRFSMPLNFERMVGWAQSDEKKIKQQFVEGVLDAYRFNGTAIQKKSGRLKAALIFSAIAAVLMVFDLVSLHLPAKIGGGAL